MMANAAGGAVGIERVVSNLNLTERAAAVRLFLLQAKAVFASSQGCFCFKLAQMTRQLPIS
jgi:hypothetical protein